MEKIKKVIIRKGDDDQMPAASRQTIKKGTMLMIPFLQPAKFTDRLYLNLTSNTYDGAEALRSVFFFFPGLFRTSAPDLKKQTIMRAPDFQPFAPITTCCIS